MAALSIRGSVLAVTPCTRDAKSASAFSEQPRTTESGPASNEHLLTVGAPPPGNADLQIGSIAAPAASWWNTPSSGFWRVLYWPLSSFAVRCWEKRGRSLSFAVALKNWLLIKRRWHFQSSPAPSPERREGSPRTFLRFAVLIRCRASADFHLSAEAASSGPLSSFGARCWPVIRCGRRPHQFPRCIRGAGRRTCHFHGWGCTARRS